MDNETNERKHDPEGTKLQQIEAKRAQKKAKGISTRDPGATYVRICPHCQKPNSLVSTFCTGCTFTLSEWDEEKLPNLFWNLAQGEDIGCKVSKRTESVVVFHDKFPVSDAHLEIIPTKAITDITELTKADIPMLKGLYSAGLTELKNLDLSRFAGKNLDDFVVAGFNYPVSIPHLHLHMVLPPFTHEKVFQYPRWHSFNKVIAELEKYGAVRTYDKHENESEWKISYNKALEDHKAFSSPKSRSKRLGPNQNFERWKKKSKDNTIVLVEVDKKEHSLTLSIDGQTYTLKYPSSRDLDSTYFLEGIGQDWENDLNEYIFTESPQSLADVLDKIVAIRDSTRGLTQSSEFIFAEGSNESEDEDQRNAREFGVGADWFKRPPKSWFCEKVIAEVKAARSLLGDDAVRTGGLSLCSLYIDITSSLDEKMMQALELFQEPCTVEFDFDPFWALKPTDRVPMPVFKIRQLTNNEGNSFGCGFHLKEIVHRYLEDNFKWSTKPLISLGSYNNDKGINRGPAPKAPKPQTTGAKRPKAAEPYVPVDSIMVSKLKQLGFKQAAIESALAESKNHYERAVDKLIGMGEAAIDINAHDIAVNSKSIDAILEMGFSRDQAVAALKKTNNKFDDAITLLLEGDILVTEAPKPQQVKVIDKSDPIDNSPQLSRSGSNLFVGIISYVKMRLAHYMRFCMICHKRHACHNDKPVVCCNPLCIFRYAEMMPAKQKQKLMEVDRITICPFVDCDNIARTDNSELLAAFGNAVAIEDGNNQEQMLAMQSHRYLPNEDVMKFINVGVKTSGQTISKIENVLKPELVAAFEAQWENMKKKRGHELSRPNIAYHGTAEQNINSILERGLLVPGRGTGKDVGHATDSGWWGGGIYLAPDPQLSIGYCRGGKKLLICSVLMGKRYNVTQRMDGADCQAGYDSHVACSGAEWVIFEPSQVLPCYLVSFKQ